MISDEVDCEYEKCFKITTFNASIEWIGTCIDDDDSSKLESYELQKITFDHEKIRDMFSFTIKQWIKGRKKKRQEKEKKEKHKLKMFFDVCLPDLEKEYDDEKFISSLIDEDDYEDYEDNDSGTTYCGKIDLEDLYFIEKY